MCGLKSLIFGDKPRGCGFTFFGEHKNVKNDVPYTPLMIITLLAD